MILDKEAEHVELFDKGVVYNVGGCVFMRSFENERPTSILQRTTHEA